MKNPWIRSWLTVLTISFAFPTINSCSRKVESDSPRHVHGVGYEQVDCMSVSEFMRQSNFLGNINETSLLSRQPHPYLIVLVAKPNGERIGFYVYNPSQAVIGAIEHLRGETNLYPAKLQGILQ
jgi:hypothetical protein